jgi:hypothetical protein
VSLGISAVLHVAVVLLYPSFATFIPEAGRVFGGFAPPTPSGTELVNLVELPSDPEPDVLPPEEVEEPEVPAVPVEAPALGPEGPPGPENPAEGNEGPTVAELLRPRAGDLRIWVPVSRELTGLSDEEKLRLMMAVELEALADSAAVADAMARAATDWTYTDEEGKRWGVSPGKLHLGDLTLPLPFGFSAPPGSAEAGRSRIWEWDVINRGAAAAEARETLKAADEAIRRRRERERRPDTTRVGGYPPSF